MVIKLKQTGEITQNGRLTLKGINGEILKILVYTEITLPTTQVKIKLGTEEVIIKDYLRESYNLFRPKVVIELTQEQIHVENYISYDKLFIDITGLGDNEKIDNITVYFK